MATLPPPDVAMDMSSPGHFAYHDSDIEIDLEDYPAGVELTDDERMLEDGDQARPGTATDENMDEDDGAYVVHEEVVMEEPQAELPHTEDFDDDLIDYDDNDNAIVEAIEVPEVNVQDFASIEPLAGVVEVPENAASSTQTQIETTAQEDQPLVTQIDENTSTEQSASVQPEANTEVEVPTTNDLSHPDFIPTKAENDSTNASKITANEDVEPVPNQADSVVSHIEAKDNQEGSEDEADDEPDSDETSSLRVDTSHNESSIQRDAPPTPSDTGLHPICLEFRDVQYALFRSRTEPSGLLDDDNLASVSLSELMAKARERLCLVTGEKISNVREVSFHFAFLEATLCEFDSRAFEFSLKEILDVYMHLQQNDEVDDIPAMVITCQLEYNFSATLKYLRHAANQGYGMESLEYMKSSTIEALQTAGEEIATADEHGSTLQAEEQHGVENDVEDDKPAQDEPLHPEDQDQEYTDGEDGGLAEGSLHGGDSVDANQQDEAHQQENDHDDALEGSDLPTAVTASNKQKAPADTSDEHVNIIDQSATTGDKHSTAQSPATTVTLQGDVDDDTASIVSLHDDVTDGHDQAEERTLNSVVAEKTGLSSEDQTSDRQQAYDDREQPAESHDVQNDDTHQHLESTADGYDEDALDETTFHTSYEFDDADQDYGAEEGEDQNKDEYEETAEAVSQEAEAGSSENTQQRKPAPEEDLLEYNEDEVTNIEDDGEAETSAAADDTHAGDEVNVEDSINFEEEEYLTVKATPANVEKSPRSKRRFEENDDFDSIDFGEDEPDIKKARAG